ncbi:hypothetical protein Sjap_022870 [Stephania japonica]|uniref:Uncharacterized protein n=1 Tax=Stephania japonica TaxID=461633 RepID=A0AAP0EWV1_9MAGN
MLGIYMQRSWIVLFVCSVLLLPTYVFATPFLKLLGHPTELAEQSGLVALWMIPLHFSFAFQFPLHRFLQSQLKTGIIAWVCLVALAVHVFISWLFVYHLQFGLIGTAVTLNFSWWLIVFGLFGYTVCGGCPLSWTGFSTQAFSGLWEFLKLSAASGVMLWWVLVLLSLFDYLESVDSYGVVVMRISMQIAVDALSICQTINGWEMMIPISFLAATGVRVANELGAGNGKGAKFATIVSVWTSVVTGVFFCFLIMFFRDKFALIFTSSPVVLDAVNSLAVLLAVTILFNSVQPVLSGVAIGSGWQAFVAYINIGSYYIIGVPLGVLLGMISDFGILGLWAGMIGGTAVQTLILAVITLRTDWEKEAQKASSRLAEFSS